MLHSMHSYLDGQVFNLKSGYEKKLKVIKMYPLIINLEDINYIFIS